MHHRQFKSHGSQCCHDSCCTGSMRQFMTREEKKARLEAYRDDLQKEMDGVNERIADLEKPS